MDDNGAAPDRLESGLAGGLDFQADPRLLCELVRALDLGVFTVAPDGRFVAWSEGAEHLTGLRRAEVEGRPCGAFDRPAAGRVRGLGLAAAVAAGASDGTVAIAGRIEGRGRRLIDLRGNVLPLLDAAGAVRGALGWFREVAGLVLPAPATPGVEAGDAAPAALRELVGQGEAMREVFRRIRLAARSDVTTLIAGESGTGKELAARAVHALGARAAGPFVAVSCSALPESLLESELFGHVEGAFTGAVRARAGVLEEAHGGTLFLDEIGDVSPYVQVKLLRALQERTIRRVGGDRDVPVDVRLVTATHRDLRALVSRGAMREDFFYRIRVYEIAMPPLRERLEDLPLLVEHLVTVLDVAQRRSVRGVSREALRCLLAHRWAGNVRELRNAIEHAFVSVEGDVIEVYDLPEDVQASGGGAGAAHPVPPRGDGLDAREVAEREHLIDALCACAWNRTETAKRLGISRVTLWKRMRRFRIDEGVFRRDG
ncbi:MAG: sigma 54-interacting transcriptional regulator [Planctomycetes bacterium]|nr:sigma 54-interacting transcriptional regulator [Planctomycetota bacterium]